MEIAQEVSAVLETLLVGACYDSGYVHEPHLKAGGVESDGRVVLVKEVEVVEQCGEVGSALTGRLKFTILDALHEVIKDLVVRCRSEIALTVLYDRGPSGCTGRLHSRA